MSVNEIRVFVFENYYKRIGFSKENSYYSMKNQKEKKALQWLAFTLTEKTLILVMLKSTINHL